MASSAAALGASLFARMQACTVAGGAETDLGVKVFRGKRTVDPTQMPCSTLIEGDDIPDKDNVGVEAKINQRYALVAFLPCDPEHPNDVAHAAIRDLKRAVFRTNGKGDRTFGGLARRLHYVGRDIAPRPDGTSFVQAGIEIEIEYVEDLANP